METFFCHYFLMSRATINERHRRRSEQVVDEHLISGLSEEDYKPQKPAILSFLINHTSKAFPLRKLGKQTSEPVAHCAIKIISN